MIKFQSLREPNPMPNSFDCFVKHELTLDQQLNLLLGIISHPKQKHDESTEIRNQISNFALTSNELSQNNKSSNQRSYTVGMGRGKSKKSHHHNLQKHTVTALRDIVKLPYFQQLSAEGGNDQKAKQIWKQFLNIKGKQVMTKKFLATLFSNQLSSVPMLRQYGFYKIYTDMSQTEILEGKIELRKQVGLLLSDKAIEEHIQRREIHRKQQFKLYLLHFRHELESTDLKKRISKSVSRELKQMARHTP